jgi:hypothetical protein
MTLRFSLLGLLGLTSFAAFACAALARPDAGWLSVIVSATALVAVLQLLRAILLSGESRAAAAGWLLFACAYVALFAGPWLNANLAPHLLTSKGLALAQAKMRSVQPQSHMQLVNGGYVDPGYSAWFDPNAINSPITMVPFPGYPTSATDALSATMFLLTGHWLLVLVTGWIGAAVAAHFHRRMAAGIPAA